jgi:hypothetical protein
VAISRTTVSPSVCVCAESIVLISRCEDAQYLQDSFSAAWHPGVACCCHYRRIVVGLELRVLVAAAELVFAVVAQWLGSCMFLAEPV